MKIEVTGIIVNAITDMWTNNAYCSYKKTFNVWCNNGDSFPNTNHTELVNLMNEVAPYVDKINEILANYSKK